MKIQLSSTEPMSGTVIDTEHTVTLDDTFIGPIFRNGSARLAVFQRDSGWEFNCWWSDGDDDPNRALPRQAQQGAVDPSGIKDFNQSATDKPERNKVECGVVTCREDAEWSVDSGYSCSEHLTLVLSQQVEHFNTEVFAVEAARPR